jgi:hypothetical protein
MSRNWTVQPGRCGDSWPPIAEQTKTRVSTIAILRLDHTKAGLAPNDPTRATRSPFKRCRSLPRAGCTGQPGRRCDDRTERDPRCATGVGEQDPTGRRGRGVGRRDTDRLGAPGGTVGRCHRKRQRCGRVPDGDLLVQVHQQEQLTAELTASLAHLRRVEAVGLVVMLRVSRVGRPAALAPRPVWCGRG